MKQYIQTLALSMAVAFSLNSCSENGIDDSGKGNYKPANYSVKGKVEKGPFINGSTINLQPMDAQLQPNVVRSQQLSLTILAIFHSDRRLLKRHSLSLPLMVTSSMK